VQETTKAIAEIIQKSKRCPKKLQTDIEKEFYNVDMQRLLKKHNINQYSMFSEGIGRQVIQSH